MKAWYLKLVAASVALLTPSGFTACNRESGDSQQRRDDNG